MVKIEKDIFKTFLLGGLYGLAIVWILLGPIVQF